MENKMLKSIVFTISLFCALIMYHTDAKAENQEGSNIITAKSYCEEGNHRGTHGSVRHPSCTNEGYLNEVCNDCGAVVTYIVYPALGHSYKRIDYIEPTCTSEGKEFYDCERCHATKINTIAKKSHAPGAWETSTPATAKMAGEKVQKCAVCNKTLSTKPISKLSSKKYSLNKSSVTLKKGKTFKIVIKNLEKKSKPKVKYKTSNKKIATVSKNGKIKARKKGRATVTVKIGNTTRKIKVRVK